MKRLKRYKELAKAAWRQLNDKDIAKAERDKDVKAFNEFFDKLLTLCYVVFGIFAFISLSLFTTRVIL